MAAPAPPGWQPQPSGPRPPAHPPDFIAQAAYERATGAGAVADADFAQQQQQEQQEVADQQHQQEVAYQQQHAYQQRQSSQQQQQQQQSGYYDQQRQPQQQYAEESRAPVARLGFDDGGGSGVVNVLDGGSMNLDSVAKVARLRQRMAAIREPYRDDGDGNGLRLVPSKRHDDM